MGIAGLMTGAGAASGLETLLARRMEEQKLAMAQQAMEEEAQHRREQLAQALQIANTRESGLNARSNATIASREGIASAGREHQTGMLNTREQGLNSRQQALFGHQTGMQRLGAENAMGLARFNQGQQNQRQRTQQGFDMNKLRFQRDVNLERDAQKAQLEDKVNKLTVEQRQLANELYMDAIEQQTPSSWNPFGGSGPGEDDKIRIWNEIVDKVTGQAPAGMNADDPLGLMQ